MLQFPEYLIICLGEEGVEIGHQVFKTTRFGRDDVNILAPHGPDNMERIVNELNDLVAVANLLSELGFLPDEWQSKKKQSEKLDKVQKYLSYARTKGTVMMSADQIVLVHNAIQSLKKRMLSVPWLAKKKTERK